MTTPDEIAAAVARVQAMAVMAMCRNGHQHYCPNCDNSIDIDAAALRLLLALATAHVSDEDKLHAITEAAASCAYFYDEHESARRWAIARRLLRLPEPPT